MKGGKNTYCGSGSFSIMKWYVYILECKNKTLYTGITNDLERRLKDHFKKTTHYTSYNPPLRIVFKKPYSTRSEAARREAEIKSWTRKKKLALIQENQAQKGGYSKDIVL